MRYIVGNHDMAVSIKRSFFLWGLHKKTVFGVDIGALEFWNLPYEGAPQTKNPQGLPNPTFPNYEALFRGSPIRFPELGASQLPFQLFRV